MGEDDLWLNLLSCSIQRCPANGIAARGIAAIGPIENAVIQIEIEIDGLRQLIEKHFDIAA